MRPDVDRPGPLRARVVRRSGERAARRAGRRAASWAGAQPAAGDSPGPQTCAFFDVDNTIIRGASMFHLAVALVRRGFLRRRDVLAFAVQNARYRLLGEDVEQMQEVRDKALSVMRGHSVPEVTAVAEDVYDEVLRLRIYPGTQRLLDEHLRAGHQVWLVSAAPMEIVALIARRVGASGAVGTVAESVDGVYTGRLVGDLLHGAAKAAAVQELAERQHIDLGSSYAYGDSTHDVAILSSVGHPCAINPDRRLRRYAAEAGWPVREFRRRTVRRGAQTAGLAGAAWVLGLAARAVRRSLRHDPLP